MSFILLVLVVLFNEQITELLKNDEISVWLYFVPISVFFTGLYNILNYFNNRKKYYKDIANANIIKSIAAAVIQLSIGLIKGGVSGLISGQLVSQIFANMRLFKNFIKDKVLVSNISKVKMISLAKRYKDFPKFSMWSSLLNTASIQMPVLLLGVYFNTVIVGFFALSHRFISMPISFMGRSIGQVFYQKSVALKDDNKVLKNLTLNTYKKLFQIGIVPFAIITVFGDYIFAFVFGKQWIIAGVYAQILSLWILFVFISSPLSNLLLTLEKQKEALYFNIAIFSSRVLALIYGGLILRDTYQTILLFGITGLLFWMFWAFYILDLTGINLSKIIFFTFSRLFSIIGILFCIRLMF
jgi:lipopolysaccharide exporter